ncbi:MAG: ferritin [Paludibacteraceae bacterium]|nr:ferritin [Paludibacteraceae bacterium]
MLSKKIQEALNAQINAELWSAYLYLSMSMNAQTKNLPGLSHWMFVQWQAELDHARILQEYMHAQNAEVQLMSIASVPTRWEDAAEMLRETLMHEQEVTAMINDLMNMAMEERDYATMNRLNWFVAEQVEEEESARDLLTTLDSLCDDPFGCYQMDQQLLRRHYEMARG